MNKILTKRTETAATFREVVDFGMSDANGRAIGVTLSVWRSVYEALPEGATFGSTAAPGVHFRAECQPTRNGEKFGAITPGKAAATQAEAEATARKMAEATRKRYAKKLGAQA